tara:strand:- start:473 stop:1012 length:540 start_codon:yes stop_codon:yes gene_type:complete
MKKFLIFFIILLNSNIAIAACDFIIDIGENKSKIVKKFAEPLPMFDKLSMLPIPSPKLCPNDKLDQDIAIEYIFLGEDLAAIRMLVLNDGSNNISNQFLLMNYAKKNFGDFDTGQNPAIYNDFYAWEKNGKIIIYQRLFGAGGQIKEEIYISNEEYDLKLGSFYNDLENEDAVAEGLEN